MARRNVVGPLLAQGAYFAEGRVDRIQRFQSSNADRQELLTQITLGNDVVSAAKDIGISISVAEQLLGEPAAIVEMATANPAGAA